LTGESDDWNDYICHLDVDRPRCNPVGCSTVVATRTTAASTWVDHQRVDHRRGCTCRRVDHCKPVGSSITCEAMMRVVVCILCILLFSGCRVTGGRWVEDDVKRCRGGVINTEKRITDTFIGGRVRNTTIRTDACLD